MTNSEALPSLVFPHATVALATVLAQTLEEIETISREKSSSPGAASTILALREAADDYLAAVQMLNSPAAKQARTA